MSKNNFVEVTIDPPVFTETVIIPGKQGIQGAKGDPGATPNIQIGTVQTLPAESPATASMTGTPENPLLNLGIPQGNDGVGINVTGATVGQTVRIAAVDDNGVPTAWEAVSFPGESGWTEIGTVTLQEDVAVWDDYIENINPSFHSFDEVAILFHFTAAEGNTSQTSASFKFRADNNVTFGITDIPYAIRTSGTFDFLIAFRKIGDLGGFILGKSVGNVTRASLKKITGFNLYNGHEGKLYGAGSTATLIGRNVA